MPVADAPSTAVVVEPPAANASADAGTEVEVIVSAMPHPLSNTPNSGAVEPVERPLTHTSNVTVVLTPPTIGADTSRAPECSLDWMTLGVSVQLMFSILTALAASVGVTSVPSVTSTLARRTWGRVRT